MPAGLKYPLNIICLGMALYIALNLWACATNNTTDMPRIGDLAPGQSLQPGDATRVAYRWEFRLVTTQAVFPVNAPQVRIALDALAPAPIDPEILAEYKREHMHIAKINQQDMALFLANLPNISVQEKLIILEDAGWVTVPTPQRQQLKISAIKRMIDRIDLSITPIILQGAARRGQWYWMIELTPPEPEQSADTPIDLTISAEQLEAGQVTSDQVTETTSAESDEANDEQTIAVPPIPQSPAKVRVVPHMMMPGLPSMLVQGHPAKSPVQPGVIYPPLEFEAGLPLGQTWIVFYRPPRAADVTPNFGHQMLTGRYRQYPVQVMLMLHVEARPVPLDMKPQ